MWKILLILSAVFAAGAAYVGYENMQSLKTEKDLLGRAKSNLEKVGVFRKDADDVLKQMTDMLTDLTNQNDKATSDYAAAAKKKTEIDAELAATKEAIDEKKAKVAAAEEKTKELGGVEKAMETVDQFNEGIALAQAEIAQLSQQNQSRTTAFKSTVRSIADHRNLELWQKSGKMENLAATVAMVSNDYKFVIINAGNNRGVVSRTKLDVRRGGSKIGEVRVPVLEPVRSVCNIKSIAPGQSIQPGDRVVVSEDSKPTDADTAEAVAKAAKAAAPPTTPEAPAESPAAPKPEADPLADPFGGLDGGLDPAMEEDKPAGDGAAPEKQPEEADPFGL